MPLYEYECGTCHRVEEVLQKVDEQAAVCGTCQAPMRKLISRTSFQLKGTGWYATDYKKSPAPAGTEPQTAASKPAETTKPA